MAFPFIAHENFEAGTAGNFETTTDVDGILDFPSYKVLARLPWSTAAPYAGAYVCRIAPSGGTNDATLTEADVNIADTVTNYFSIRLWFAPDFTGTADDTFALLELKGAAAAVTVSFGGRVVASDNTINLGIGAAASSAAPTAFTPWDIQRGVWYTCELKVAIETDGSGTVDLYITKEGDVSQETADASVSTITNIAVTDGVLGLQDHLSTTTGTILIDHFIQDDGRIYAQKDRFKEEVMITKSGHIFMGQGTIDNVTLLSGAGTDNVLKVFDTDSADVNDDTNVRAELKNTANNETVSTEISPVNLVRGAYVELAGTNPRALVRLKRAASYGSSGAIRNVGR